VCFVGRKRCFIIEFAIDDDIDLILNLVGFRIARDFESTRVWDLGEKREAIDNTCDVGLIFWR
jgi:hypothetical protein